MSMTTLTEMCSTMALFAEAMPKQSWGVFDEVPVRFSTDMHFPGSGNAEIELSLLKEGVLSWIVSLEYTDHVKMQYTADTPENLLNGVRKTLLSMADTLVQAANSLA